MEQNHALVALTRHKALNQGDLQATLREILPLLPVHDSTSLNPAPIYSDAETLSKACKGSGVRAGSSPKPYPGP